MVLTILQMMVYTVFVALGLVFFTIGLPETFPKSNIESHPSMNGMLVKGDEDDGR